MVQHIIRITILLFVVSNLSAQDYEKANSLFEAGKYGEAAKEYEKIMPDLVKEFGENDTTTLPIYRYLLGMSYYYNAENDKAAFVLENNVDQCKINFKTFSEWEINTLDALIDLYTVDANNAKKIVCKKRVVAGYKRNNPNAISLDLGYSYNVLGIEYFSQALDKEAIVAYQQAIETLEKCTDKSPTDLPVIKVNLANSYAYSEQYDLAKKHYKEGFQAAYNIDPKGFDTVIQPFSILGKQMSEGKMDASAKKVYQIAIDVRKEIIGEMDVDLIDCYINLATSCHYLDENKNAVSNLKLAQEVVDSNFPVGSEKYNFWYSYLGYQYETNKEWKRAAASYAVAFDQYQQLIKTDKSKTTAYIMTNSGLIRSYHQLRDFPKEIKQLLIEIDYYNDLNIEKNRDPYVQATIELAGALKNQNKSTDAAIVLEETHKKVRKNKPSALGYVDLLTELIMVNIETSNFDKAMKYVDEKIPFVETNLGKEIDYYISLNEKGEVYLTSGEYIKANEYFLKAAVYECTDDYLNCVNIYNNVALSQLEMGNYKQAEKTYLNIKEIHESHDAKTENYIISLFNLGRLYLDTERFQDAEDIYTLGKQLAEEVTGKESKLYLSNTQGLANSYLRNGKIVASMELFKESILLIKKLYTTDDSYAVQLLGNIAFALCIAQEFDAATSMLENVIKSQRYHLGRSNPITMLTAANLAAAYQSNGQMDKSKDVNHELVEILMSNINYSLNYLSESESIQYLNRLNLYLSSPFSYLAKEYKNDPKIVELLLNNSIQMKGKLLQSNTALKRQIMKSDDPKTIETYKDWKEKVLAITNLQATGSNLKLLDKTIEEANVLEKQLIAMSKDYAKSLRITYDWKDIQKKLKDNEYVLEFVNFNQHTNFIYDTLKYGVFIFGKTDAQPTYVPLFNGDELIDIIGDYGGNNLEYIQGIYGKNREKSKLYDLIWKKIAPLVPEQSAVIISPSGLLHKISFAGISDGKLFLNEKYNIKNVTATSTLLAIQKKSMSDIKPIIIGGINYDLNVAKGDEHVWQYLQGTATEAAEIKLLFENQGAAPVLLTKDNVTEQNITQKIADRNLVHFATHGFFYPNPEDVLELATTDTEEIENVGFRGGTRGMGYNLYVESKNALMRSGLALTGANQIWNNTKMDISADGILTAQDIVLMDLENLELAVLSACETGLGDIQGSEGVFGLQRSLKMAGTKNVIMSLWQVPDKETKEFMILFYEKLIALKDVEQAFKTTQRIMSKKYDTYYWAAFVLV